MLWSGILRPLRIATVTATAVLCLPSYNILAQVRTSPKPFSKDDVIRMLKGDVFPKRVEELVQERGTSFAMTEEIEKELRAAGATNELLKDLRALAPRPVGSIERATGDIGVMSGPIARNHSELEELQRRGDRNYYEFTITKSENGEKVGPIQLTLNKTDPKKSKYTLTVLVDDRTIEKRYKTAGEPVQFYVKGSSRDAPYELVVFNVDKNIVTGYLSVPKQEDITDVTSSASKLVVPTNVSPATVVMSSPIARNRTELEDPKRNGHRNYYEFTLAKSKDFKKVGPIQLRLNKTMVDKDRSLSKYTLTILCDDKTLEKKDRSEGEPVQFYVQGTPPDAPYELVVFNVDNDIVTGYLSVPK
jgi:hypothetical protein